MSHRFALASAGVRLPTHGRSALLVRLPRLHLAAAQAALLAERVALHLPPEIRGGLLRLHEELRLRLGVWRAQRAERRRRRRVDRMVERLSGLDDHSLEMLGLARHRLVDDLEDIYDGIAPAEGRVRRSIAARPATLIAAS